MTTEAKAVDWPDMFIRYEQSGLNQKAFCDRAGIPFFSQLVASFFVYKICY